MTNVRYNRVHLRMYFFTIEHCDAKKKNAVPNHCEPLNVEIFGSLQSYLFCLLFNII